MSTQTRIESIIESTINTASGFILSFAVWQWLVAPMFGFNLPVSDNFWITVIFTVVSVARSYVWRRFFNAGLHRVIRNYLRSEYGRVTTH